MKKRFLMMTGFIVLALGTFAAQGDVLYSVAKGDGMFRTVDPADGSTMSSVEITLDGNEIAGMTGLAMQPGTGIFYALIKSGSRRLLATIDPDAGTAELIGDTGDKFAGISFTSGGVLYGVTGDGADEDEQLFTLSLDDATATHVMNLGDGDDGEAIGFNPDNGLMYHASGRDRDEDGIFQSIDLDDQSIIDIALFGDDTYDEAVALAYAGGGLFFMPDIDEDLYTLGVGGEVTFIGSLDHPSKGLVYVPEPGSLALLGIGALGLLRRRSQR